MSQPPYPDLPPDLPPEYAEAYRRGFERAYREALGEPLPADDLEGLAHAEAEAEVERTQRLESLDQLLQPEAEYAAPAARDAEKAKRPAWLVPALMAGAVVLLLLMAYFAGLIFSSSVDSTDLQTEEEPTGIVMSEEGETSPPAEETKPSKKPRPSKKPDGETYQGRTEVVPVSGSSASCTAPPSVDSAGNQVSYEPPLAYDGDLTTAWRCNGDGVGQTLTLNLPEEVRIGELGLVPGYAKTDPRSGADRYAENNRLTRVRWTFPDGTSFEQGLDGSPTNRDMQTFRIPLTAASEVTLEVLASAPGQRNTIAVSEIRIGSALG
jgi:hypothetical protein